MNHDIQALKERLLIYEAWRILGLPGEPATSCRSPFRPDRKPSFSVFDGGKRWKDHSTGEGGDVIDLIAHALDISRSEATKRFIEMAGGGFSHAYIPSGRSFTPRDPKAGDRTAEEKAAKRSKWSFLDDEPESRDATAALRGISTEALKIAEMIGTLRYSDLFGFKCWILTDEAQLVAEARRVDGHDFPELGNLPERKAHTLGGSIKTWPAGTAALKKLPSISRVMMVEGGPDYLAALHFASAHIDAHGGAADILPVAILGRGACTTIDPDALAILAGKRVRIYPHHDADGGGLERANIWAAQLHAAGCMVDSFLFDNLTRQDGEPVNDLNDLCYIPATQLSEITNLLP